MKKKLCLVADVPNWAFDKIAQKLKKSLSDKYDITIKYFNRRDEQDNFLRKFQKYSLKLDVLVIT